MRRQSLVPWISWAVALLTLVGFATRQAATHVSLTDHHDGVSHVLAFLATTATSSRSTSVVVAPDHTTGVIRNNGMVRHNTTRLLPPFRVWQDYVAAHSVQALRREWDETRSRLTYNNNNNSTPAFSPHRQFTVAYYSCPLQAGNRLHHFFNQLLWAVVTNRTLLWKYYDQASCRALSAGKFDPQICPAANRVADCDVVLGRAPWMASYEDWAARVGALPVTLNVWTTHPPETMTLLSRSSNNNSNNDPSETLFTPFHFVVARKFGPYERPATAVDAHPARVVIFPLMLAKYRDLGAETLRETLLQTAAARARAADLYALGADFLYGLLFRQTFRLRDDNYNDTTRTRAIPPDAFTLAVHSRHVRAGDPGKRIQDETACLEKLLRGRRAGQPCVVFVMADRQATRQRLQAWLAHTQDCQVAMTQHTSGTKSSSFRKEHGPFAGAAFFQDLRLASRARDGVVGGDRSSTDLLREWIAYERVMEAGGGTNVGVAPLPQCLLP
jgi:hypothetical protein